MEPQEYRKHWNWKADPFIIQVEDQPIVETGMYEWVTGEIEGGNRLLFITAEIGIGKSTLAYELQTRGGKYKGQEIKTVYYRQDVTYDKLIKTLESNLPLVSKIFRPQTLVDGYRKAKPLMLILDEAQDYIGKDEQTLGLIRDIANVNCNLIIVMMGTLDTEGTIRYGSVRDRYKKILLNRLTEDQLLKMIELRILRVGGEGYEPIGKENVRRIIEYNNKQGANNNPRKLLSTLTQVVDYHARLGILETVNETSLKEALSSIEGEIKTAPTSATENKDYGLDINRGAFDILAEGLNDKTKTLLLTILGKKEANIETLIKETGISRATIYRQLDVLKEKEMIIPMKDSQDGKKIVFRISDNIFRKLTAK
jgi:DNA-binding transcriptional ArsR family regulator